MGALVYSAAIFARIVVGAVLLLAAAGKIRRPDVFARTLRAYSVVPAFLQGSLAIAIPSAEAALGVAVVTGVVPMITGPLVVVMLLLFAGVTVATFGWNATHECGCFGVPTPIAIKRLAGRNVVLAALAILGATQGPSLSPLIAASLVSAVLAVTLLVQMLEAAASVTTAVADPRRRRFLGLAVAVVGAGGLLALTNRGNIAEATCYGCQTCSTSYIFIACTGGGCAAYWVRTREYCDGGCATCGTWMINEYCGIPGC